MSISDNNNKGIIKDRWQRGARCAFILAGGLCFEHSKKDRISRDSGDGE